MRIILQNSSWITLSLVWSVLAWQTDTNASCYRHWQLKTVRIISRNSLKANFAYEIDNKITFSIRSSIDLNSCVQTVAKLEAAACRFCLRWWIGGSYTENQKENKMRTHENWNKVDKKCRHWIYYRERYLRIVSTKKEFYVYNVFFLWTK